VKLSVGGKIACCSPHPVEPLLAVVEQKTCRLRVLSFDGSPIFEEATAPGMLCCRFDSSGDYLWCAARLSKDKVEIQLRETASWRILGRDVVQDPFGGSDASLHPDGGTKAMALWLAAGQDGQCVYSITRDGVRIGCALDPRLRDTTPPVFLPNSEEFLVNEGDDVKRYNAASAEDLAAEDLEAQDLGVCESPFGEDDPFDCFMCYLNDSWALAGSVNGRIAVIHAPDMRILAELVVEGHEPRPAEAYFPALADDDAICTDISSFERVGDFVIFAYHLAKPEGASSKREEAQSVLLGFPVRYILEKLPFN
jgi:hypothetical protein